MRILLIITVMRECKDDFFFSGGSGAYLCTSKLRGSSDDDFGVIGEKNHGVWG